jgi:GNAT superfamily N-acetyltransferase
MTIDVRPIRAEEVDLVLPLFAAYQRFYVAEPDDERNRRFVARFVAPSDDGVVLGAWDDEGELVGFALLYWTFSSTRAAEVAVMNDLFVRADQRGRGAGRALIDAALRATVERGGAHLEWLTAPDNLAAQRVYDATGASRSTWIAYELEPRDPSRGGGSG